MATSEPPETKTAKPPQFSLLTLMLFVTIVGMYCGMVRWVIMSPEMFKGHGLIFFGGSMCSFALCVSYWIWNPPRWAGPVIPIGVFILSVCLYYVIQAIWGRAVGDPKVIVSLNCFYFFTVATFISILHSKEQTGSWLPMVRKSPEGESDE